MKITKQQIKQIIKEEIAKVLLESSGFGEAHDAGYEDGSRGLEAKYPGDMDYMAGWEMGEEDAQYDAERAIKTKKDFDSIQEGGAMGHYDGPTAEEETHRNRVKQGSGVLSSKMASLVSDAYKLADDMGRDEARKMFIAAGEELQTMTSPSDNPATKLVIEQLKFLLQPGVLMTEIGQAMTAFDE